MKIAITPKRGEPVTITRPDDATPRELDVAIVGHLGRLIDARLYHALIIDVDAEHRTTAMSVSDLECPYRGIAATITYTKETP